MPVPLRQGLGWASAARQSVVEPVPRRAHEHPVEQHRRKVRAEIQAGAERRGRAEDPDLRTPGAPCAARGRPLAGRSPATPRLPAGGDFEL